MGGTNFERLHPHGEQHTFDFRDQLPPLSGTLRLYVDGTLGSDAAAGTSWATAWRTLNKLIQSVAAILSLSPNGLTILVRLRGSFGATDHLAANFQINGDSSVIIACDFADSLPAVNGTGTVTTVGGEAPVPLHGLQRLTLGGGITVAATMVGLLIRLYNAGTGNIGTYQILRVDTVNNYVWITELIGSTPAWLVGAGAVAAVIFTSGAIIQGNTQIANDATTRIPSGTTKALTLLNLRCYVGPRIGPAASIQLSLDCRNAAGTAQDCSLYGCTSAQRVFQLSMSTALSDELGFTLGASPSLYCGTNCKIFYVYGGEVSATGYCSDRFRIQNGAHLSCLRTNAGIYDCYAAVALFVVNGMGRGVSGHSVGRATPGGVASFTSFSVVDMYSAGVPDGAFRADDGGAIYLESVECNNTGTAVSGLWAVQVREGGVVVIGPSCVLTGKHGNIRNCGGYIETQSDMTVAASAGGGSDLYAESGEIRMLGSYTKSALNTIASPVLTVARGGKVTQATGKNFTLPAGSGNYVTDYGAKGPIVADDGLCDLRLGNLTGGTGATTGPGATLRNGARLVHAGLGLSGSGVSGPLVLGGLPAGPWPAAALTDAGAVVPEGCVCIPGVT